MIGFNHWDCRFETGAMPAVMYCVTKCQNPKILSINLNQSQSSGGMRDLDESRPFNSLDFCWQVTFDTCVSNLGSRPKWHRGGTRLERASCIKSQKLKLWGQGIRRCSMKTPQTSTKSWAGISNMECANGPMQNSAWCPFSNKSKKADQMSSAAVVTVLVVALLGHQMPPSMQ